MATYNERMQFLSSLEQRKKTFEMTQMRIMSESDFEIASRMESIIPFVIPNFMHTGAFLTQQEAFSQSYEYLKEIDPIYVDAAKEIEMGARVRGIYDINYAFSTYIEYEVDPATKKVTTKGRVDHFKTPKKFDGISPMWLAHEHIHALKETRHREYVDAQVLGDVIPMFLELLIADRENSEKASILMKERLFLLKQESLQTQRVRQEIFRNDVEDDLYKVFATSSMQYLNSYYYSILLYDLYRKNSRVVLTHIRSVLDGKETTRQMLQKMGLLRPFDIITATSGIEMVKKRIL